MGLKKPAPLVERDFGQPAVPDTCPGFGFLSGELDGDGMVRSRFDSGMCRGDDAVVIAGRQSDPPLCPDLVCPRLDLGMISFFAEGQCCLACRLGGRAITGVVFDACDQQRDPACESQDLATSVSLRSPMRAQALAS
jgi:hypothetical protein